MTVTIPTKAAAPLAAADEKSGDVDELDLSQRLLTAVPPESPLSEGERKGMYAECAAFRFCAARDSGGRTWDMYWQPMSSMLQGERTMHSPSIEPINEDILAYWFNRLSAVRHPVLKARYADLAWEVTRLFKGRWTPPNAEARNPYKPNIAAALAAIDAYLDAVEHGVVVDPFRAWGFVGRAVELAASVSDTARLARAKTLLLRTWSAQAIRGDRYPFWRADDIAWNQAKVLNLTDEDRRAIVDILERELALRSDPGRPEQFDPPVAQDAADRLGRWHQAQGRAPAALHAAQVAGNAVEAGAPAASGLTALAMLGQQANRYRDIGDMTAVARVEETIRARAPEAKTGLRHIQIPIEIPPEELETWLDQISGATLEEGVARVTVNAIVRRASTERTVMDAAKQSPLSSRIPIAIMRDDGFTSAVIESVEDDLDGRVVHYAANLMGGAYAPFLNLSLERLRTKHGFTADAVVAWLSPCTFFAPNRLPLLRAGLDAWFAEDWIKAIHVLIPQVEAALRDVVRALGGAVMKPDGDGHGFQALTLGPLLRHERFVAGVPEDVRFHLSVLYQDSRGLNVRNEVAHGLAPMPLIDRAIANWVVHSILLVGLMRIQQPGTQPADGGAVSAEN